MTQDELMELAREAGFKVWADGRITAADGGISGSATQSLTKFAALVAAAERERCAKVCDSVATGEGDEQYAEGSAYCADAIRAMKD